MAAGRSNGTGIYLIKAPPTFVSLHESEKRQKCYAVDFFAIAAVSRKTVPEGS